MSALDDALRLIANTPAKSSRTAKVLETVGRAKTDARIASSQATAAARKRDLWKNLEQSAADAPNNKGAVGQATLVAPADVIGRWYKNGPGGLGGAVQDSQKAMSEYPIDGYEFYGSWKPQDMDRVAAARAQWFFPNSSEMAYYSPGDREIRLASKAIKDKARRRGTLEHEATHHLLLSGALDSVGSGKPSVRALLSDSQSSEPFYAADIADRVRRELEMRGEEPQAMRHFLEYASTKSELDPRIAEVRRRYTHETGNPVRTPEDAEAAWRWYGQNEAFQPPTNDMPTMSSRVWNFYDQLPEEAKRTLFRRMTHVPAWLAPVAASPLAGLGEDGGSGIAK